MLIFSDYSDESVVFCSSDEADVGARRLGVVDAFLAAEACQLGKAVAWLDVIEDAVDGVFAGHVLDLATAEVKLLAQCLALFSVQFGNHLLPKVGSHAGIGALK